MIWYTTDSLATYCSYCNDDQERVNRKRYKIKGSCLKEHIICILGESGTKNGGKFTWGYYGRLGKSREGVYKGT